MKQRTVLISGASRGIGRAVSERLLKDGHRLSLGLRDPSVLDGTALDADIVQRHGLAHVSIDGDHVMQSFTVLEFCTAHHSSSLMAKSLIWSPSGGSM